MLIRCESIAPQRPPTLSSSWEHYSLVCGHLMSGSFNCVLRKKRSSNRSLRERPSVVFGKCETTTWPTLGWHRALPWDIYSKFNHRDKPLYSPRFINFCWGPFMALRKLAAAKEIFWEGTMLFQVGFTRPFSQYHFRRGLRPAFACVERAT